jgi:hypothetical protein
MVKGILAILGCLKLVLGCFGSFLDKIWAISAALDPLLSWKWYIGTPMII